MPHEVPDTVHLFLAGKIDQWREDVARVIGDIPDGTAGKPPTVSSLRFTL
jgi:hypothetical protein